jgi:hypothetical protein
MENFMGERAKSFGQLLIAGLLSGSVIAAVIGFVLNEQTTRVEEEVRSQFKTAFEIFRSQHDWKKQSLAELLGPMNMQLRRTKLAFMRWDDLNLYLEMTIIAKGNETARDLLLTKGYLIPPELMECSSRLIEHYDVWLEKFERERKLQKPDLETRFIFTGPDGYPFPSECDTKFRQKYRELWEEVYGEGLSSASG